MTAEIQSPRSKIRNRFALFLGCTVPVRAQNYELSARKVAAQLGIELVDLPGLGCCGFPLKSLDRSVALHMTAHSLAVAEAAELDVVALCSSCAGVLTEARHELLHDESLRAEINASLAQAGETFRGTSKVLSLTRLLVEVIGVDAIRQAVSKPFAGLRVASHEGCHLLKPSEAYDHFDDPEAPTVLDRLVEATGATPVHYANRLHCCGGGVLAFDETLALKMAKVKLDSIHEADAHVMVLVCPFCSVMYESQQRKIESAFETTYGLPVLYYPQLLGLAMGMSDRDVGLQMNVVKPQAVLERVRSG